MQLAEPRAAEYLPGLQRVQLEAPASAYRPAAQLTQYVRPGPPWNLPAAQLTHEVEPAAVLILPGAQRVHEVEPAAAYRPAAQFWQTPSAMYIPALQGAMDEDGVGVRDDVGVGVRDGVRVGVRDGVRVGVRDGVRVGVREGVLDGVGELDGVALVHPVLPVPLLVVPAGHFLQPL